MLGDHASLIAYAAGYFYWFVYAVTRFIPAEQRGSGEEIAHAMLALVWPFCVAVYLPYRVARVLARHGGGDGAR